MYRFNLQKALEGWPVITRCGDKVVELHLIEKALDFPLVGLIEGERSPTLFTIDGRVSERHDVGDDLDLFLADKITVVWANYYRDSNGQIQSLIYESKEEADLSPPSFRIGQPKRVELVESPEGVSL